MIRDKAPFYMGGGTETELNKFDLQRFATVDNPYESVIHRNEIASGDVSEIIIADDTIVFIPTRDRFVIGSYGTLIRRKGLGEFNSILYGSSYVYVLFTGNTGRFNQTRIYMDFSYNDETITIVSSKYNYGASGYYCQSIQQSKVSQVYNYLSQSYKTDNPVTLHIYI